MDITQQRETWRNFVRLIATSVFGIAFVLALMAIFLT